MIHVSILFSMSWLFSLKKSPFTSNIIILIVYYYIILKVIHMVLCKRIKGDSYSITLLLSPPLCHITQVKSNIHDFTFHFFQFSISILASTFSQRFYIFLLLFLDITFIWLLSPFSFFPFCHLHLLFSTTQQTLLWVSYVVLLSHFRVLLFILYI